MDTSRLTDDQITDLEHAQLVIVERIGCIEIRTEIDNDEPWTRGALESIEHPQGADCRWRARLGSKLLSRSANWR